MSKFEKNVEKCTSVLFDDLTPFTLLLLINIIVVLIFIAAHLNTGVAG